MANIPYVETDWRLNAGVGVNLRSGQKRGLERYSRQLEGTRCRAKQSQVSSTRMKLSACRNLPHHFMPGTQTNAYQVAGLFRELTCRSRGQSGPVLQLDASLIEVQCPVEGPAIPLSIMSKKDKKWNPRSFPARFQSCRPVVCLVRMTCEISPDVGPLQPALHEPKSINEKECYGLCFYRQDAQEGEFEYVAAREVADDQNVPEGNGLPRGTGLQVCPFFHPSWQARYPGRNLPVHPITPACPRAGRKSTR